MHFVVVVLSEHESDLKVMLLKKTAMVYTHMHAHTSTHTLFVWVKERECDSINSTCIMRLNVTEEQRINFHPLTRFLRGLFPPLDLSLSLSLSVDLSIALSVSPSLWCAS